MHACTDAKLTGVRGILGNGPGLRYYQKFGRSAVIPIYYTQLTRSRRSKALGRGASADTSCESHEWNRVCVLGALAMRKQRNFAASKVTRPIIGCAAQRLTSHATASRPSEGVTAPGRRLPATRGHAHNRAHSHVQGAQRGQIGVLSLAAFLSARRERSLTVPRPRPAAPTSCCAPTSTLLGTMVRRSSPLYIS